MGSGAHAVKALSNGKFLCAPNPSTAITASCNLGDPGTLWRFDTVGTAGTGRFRIFSLNPRPRYVWQRADLTYVDRREAGGVEQLSLYPDHVVIRCTYDSDDIELA